MGKGGEIPLLPRLVIMAFGKRGYTLAAANLAASIKAHNPDIKIDLFCQPDLLKYVSFDHIAKFDFVTAINPAYYMSAGTLDPGKCKARLYDLLKDGEYLYVDADSLCVKDLGPLLTKLQADGRHYITDVFGKGSGQDKIEYTPWASPKKQAEKLPEGATIYGLQTSWAFIRKCEESKTFFERVRFHYDNGTWTGQLDRKWGKSMPDELLYAFTCSELGVDPSWSRDVMFFGNKHTLDSMDEIRGAYYFMSQYGNGDGRTLVKPRYLAMYDREMKKVFAPKQHEFPLHFIMMDKYLNRT